jgi:hypothetical protein
VKIVFRAWAVRIDVVFHVLFFLNCFLLCCLWGVRIIIALARASFRESEAENTPRPNQRFEMGVRAQKCHFMLRPLLLNVLLPQHTRELLALHNS